MNNSTLLHELPAIGFLADMDSSQRAFLASFGKFIRPHSGESVIGQGQAQDHLHLVLSGILHVVVDGGDKPLHVATLGAGDSLGEINLFDPTSASASVYARNECLIWKISGDEVRAFFKSDAEAGIEFMKGLLKLGSHRLRGMNDKLVDAVGMAKAIKAMTLRS